jgi:hypothetical protein
VHLRGLDPNRTVPAIIRNEPAQPELSSAQSPRQKIGWWVGAALVGAALTLAFALGQYSRSAAVANTATRNADVSAPPAAPTDPVLAAVTETASAGDSDDAPATSRPAPKSAKPMIAAPLRAVQAAPAAKPKKAASAFGRTADELDVGY